MAYIEWEDESGTGTLTPSYPSGPARRFRNWTPEVKSISAATHDLGTGRRREFRFRRDELASFQIPGILPTQHAMFLRFKRWVLQGCSFFVYTEDAAARVYECRLAPDTMPELALEDSQQLEYTISLVVPSIAGDPMICDYRS